LCRTCKHWNQFWKPYGLGTCMNGTLQDKVIVDLTGPFRVAHDFGCALHEPGSWEPCEI